MGIISNYYYHFPLLRNNALLRFQCSNFRGRPPTKMMINVKDRDRLPPKVIAPFRESMNIFYSSSLLHQHSGEEEVDDDDQVQWEVMWMVALIIIITSQRKRITRTPQVQ